MTIESLDGVNNKPDFKEGFQSEQHTRDIGGVPANIVYDHRVAEFNGTSSEILYRKNLSGTYSVRAKVKKTSNGVIEFIVDYRFGVSPSSSFIYVNASNNVIVSAGTVYIDGVQTNALSIGEWQEVFITGIPIKTSGFYVGTYAIALLTVWTGYIDFFETYEGTLTAEEVKNLYNGVRYRALSPQTTTQKEITNIDSRRGAIYDTYGNTITNTDVEIVRDGEVYVEKYNGSTSKLQISSIASQLWDNDFSVSFWCKHTDNNNKYPFSMGNTANSTLAYAFSFQSSGSIQFFIRNNDGSFLDLVNSGKQVEKNEYNFYTIVKTTNNTKIYVNGEVYIDKNYTESGDFTFNLFGFGALLRSSPIAYFIGNQGKKSVRIGALTLEEHSQIFTSQKSSYGK